MHKWQCPKCGQKFKTDIELTRPPVCARKDRKVSHPAKMVKVVRPQRA